MGIHVEPGIRRAPLAPADEVADELAGILLEDRPPADGEPLLVLVNTLGATPAMEGFVLLRRLIERLEHEGVLVHRDWSASTSPRWRWRAPPSRSRTSTTTCAGSSTPRPRR